MRTLTSKHVFVEGYLQFELTAEAKHEYVAGGVVAINGATLYYQVQLSSLT